MAQSDWTAGYELIVTVDGVRYPFKTADVEASAKEINRANSKYDPEFEVIQGGQKSQSLTAEGPYRQGEIDLSVGAEYDVTVQPTAAHPGYTATYVLLSRKFSDDVEDGPKVSCTFKTQASFDKTFS